MSNLSFSANFDPSKPLEIFDSLISYVSENSDLLKSDSGPEQIYSHIRSAIDARTKKNLSPKMSNLSFSDNYDPSDPFEFFGSVMCFLSKNSELLKSDSGEEKLHSFIRVFREMQSITATITPSQNEDNGMNLPCHSWTQMLDEVTVTVPVLPRTNWRFVSVDISRNHLKVGVQGQPPLMEGELFEAVKVCDSIWCLEDQRYVTIQLAKCREGWWKSLVKGDPEIDLNKVRPETVMMSNLDSESFHAVEKAARDLSCHGKWIEDELTKRARAEEMPKYPRDCKRARR